MNIPTEWSSLVRERVKKRNAGDDASAQSVGSKRKKTDRERNSSPDGSVPTSSFQDACKGILQAITSAIRNSTPMDAQLAFDHIMSSGAYRSLVESLFVSDEGREPPKIPVVSRLYEESFLRGPLSKDEPLCVMQGNCECMFIDETRPFVGVQFTLPQEGVMVDNLCVCCHRRLCQNLFYDLLYIGQPFRGVIQKYGVICNERNEYLMEDLLICPAGGPVECFPLPSVIHQRNRYRCLPQTRAMSGVTQLNS